jgi:hypothetical protein
MEVKAYVDKKFADIVDAVDIHKNPELIEKEAFVGSARCAFCPYAKRCWPEISDKQLKKEYYKTMPEKDWPRDTDRMGEQGATLEEIYADFKKTVDATIEFDKYEQELCEAIYNSGVKKVRFADGEVYEIKFLKSPKPHYELRRSK